MHRLYVADGVQDLPQVDFRLHWLHLPGRTRYALISYESRGSAGWRGWATFARQQSCARGGGWRRGCADGSATFVTINAAMQDDTRAMLFRLSSHRSETRCGRR